ncbi:MAG: hypothetical protein RMN25_13730, partial [Anaerolineae bacterium]|nr:hypothetical protein [Thermoflexales bacterium]MDW8408832.1 hypothetical protein [Anaerolineae bacterium]
MGKLQQQITVLSSADELRLRLDKAEKILRFETREAARDVLTTLHEAHRMADALERDTPGLDLRPERARLSALDERVLRYAHVLVKALGGPAAFEAFRTELGGRPDEVWWQLDAKIAADRRRLVRRLAIVGLVLVALGAAVWLA